MKFLIIKTSSLGDIIHALGALSFLRQKFPHATIDWVVEEPFSELLQAHPALNNIFSIATKKWRRGRELKKIFPFYKKLRKTKYDMVFDFQGNIKSSCVLACARSSKKIGFGWKTVHEWPSALFTNIKFDPPKGKNIREDALYLVQSTLKDFSPATGLDMTLKIQEEQREEIDSLLKRLPQGQKILVAPGSAWENKQLSHEGLISVLEKLHACQKAFFLFSWGNENEKKLSEALQRHFPENSLLLKRYPLPVLQNLMGKIDLVVAMDSLPLHLCGTTKTKALGFFGPTSALKFMPTGEHHTYVQGVCPYKMVFEKRCPKMRTCKTGACIKEIR